jgi:divalent metal cation (Fe/Co/Zn/Cd) transporter
MAYANMRGQIESRDWSGFREAFRKTSDVTVLTAFTEDTIAMLGAGIALIGIFLTRQTGNPIYDAVTALLIGLMLMGFALALAWENKRLLLGESLPTDDERALRALLDGYEDVTEILDFRTVYFGPDRVVIAADVVFADGLGTTEINRLIDDIEEAFVAENGAIEKVYLEPKEGPSGR